MRIGAEGNALESQDAAGLACDCLVVTTGPKRRKPRPELPITFVTSEPGIGHFGLGGVADSKTMLESEFRSNDIKWIANAKVTKVEAGKMFVTELDKQGGVQKAHVLPFRYSMMFDI